MNAAPAHSRLIAEMKTASSRQNTRDGSAGGVKRTKMVGPNAQTSDEFWEELAHWSKELDA